ncbi:MAG: nitroreductase family deazaflavin-dependent oxidoreductase [Candidatus Microbacterium stercoravium]
MTATGDAGRMIDVIIARLLGTPWLMRLPIPLYRAGLGRLLGRRLVMIEHVGRSSGEPRYVVVEVVEREGRALRVASGFGTRAQWYRNLRANGIAHLSTGGVRRERVRVNLLDDERSCSVLERYTAAHPAAWRRLKSAMDIAQGRDARILVVEFVPFD